MDGTTISFHSPGSRPDGDIRFAVILTRMQGRWLFVRHKQRSTWEIPGGHREIGETPKQAAARELREETGATDFSLTPVCIYGVSRGGEAPSFGLLAFAEVRALGPLDPLMEIGEVSSFAEPPEAMTYPDIQPALFRYMQNWLNMQSSPDELWDVYDANRRLTGRTHRRGDPLAPGEYHLVVQVYVRRPTGEFLITKRAPTKGYPLMWENTGGSADAGEDSLTAALREVREETGLCADPARARLVMQVMRPDAFVDIYELVHDFELSDVVLLPGETVDARLVSGEEILRLHETGQFVPHDYLPGLMDRLMGVKRQA